jgi:hypothetical protein
MSLPLIPRVRYENLVTPTEHLGVLVEPEPVAWRAQLTAGPARDLAAVTILGRPLEAWRRTLRERLGLNSPVVAAGHQAEFSHAGVFAKTIALHALASATGAAGVFFTADHDLPKGERLIVPEIAAGGLRQTEVPIPGHDAQRPIERQAAVPRGRWLDFFTRVASVYEHYDVSLLRPFADAWLAGDEAEITFRDGARRGWTAVEQALDLTGLHHVNLSALCATPEFRAFAAHLILHAARSAHAYNAAQTAYRVRHRVRSRNRPVPPLVTSPERTEVPLWLVLPDGRRERLQVVMRGDRVILCAGVEPVAEIRRLDLADPAALEQAWPFERDGWDVRPRALALSALVRLLLADFYIHGIGGAKYDEITEEWLTSLFGAPPAPIGCVTATAFLPLPRTGVRWADVLAARHAARDLIFNPQRHLPDVPAGLLRRRSESVRRSDELRAARSRNRQERRLMFEAIRLVSAEILSTDPWRAAELEQNVRTLEQRYNLDRIAFDREYFAALHLRSTLRDLVQRVRTALELG